ncbi:CoA transferase [Chelativorans sp. Marseille-P2723]|uniref:CaiB/BaiF CoA transferase family protein n=1 Tax=Chelativorans sp. Marseille-P2723 TaxID=2709133 RepID=UPI00156D9DC8|nr:CoA transferase [Chelativorans sp. Marseille-P2723]
MTRGGNPPLKGVRVADFTWIGAGSFTTKLLADCGAEVIKIETATHLDTLRMTPPFRDDLPGVNRSGYFADRNSSKLSICLNVKTPAGLDLARRLVAISDVVANNFRPRVMDRLGLGYDYVRKLKSDIIYLSMSMQGSAGPDAHSVGFGLTIGALSGLQSLAGPVDRPPAGSNTNYPDHVPNPCHAAFAVMAALIHRNRTGKGQFIDLAQTEPMVALLAPHMLQYAVDGVVVERMGNDDPTMCPHGVYPCAGNDRWIAIACASDAEWARLSECLGGRAPRRWANADCRRAERAKLDAWIGARSGLLDRYALMRDLQDAGIAAGVVQDARDLVENDPQLAHRGRWVRLSHPEMKDSIYGNVPYRLTRTPAKLFSPAPLLGEHTEHVCREVLGISAGEFETYRAKGAFE